MESEDKLIITDGMNSIRSTLARELSTLSDLQKLTKPPVVQELVLAQRALEDARMRIGVARTLLQGENPYGGV